MTISIYGNFQAKVEGKWINVKSNFTNSQKPELFEWLAGVKCDEGLFADEDGKVHYPPIAKNRGFPVDMDVHASAAKIYGSLGLLKGAFEYGTYGFSWVSADEMLNAPVAYIGVCLRFKETEEVFVVFQGKRDRETLLREMSQLNICSSQVNEVWQVYLSITEILNDCILNETRRLKAEYGEVRFVFGFDN